MQDNNLGKEAMVFTSCNICGSSKYREICNIEIAPFLTPSKLVKCKKCGLFYANPRLKKETEEDYYRKRYHEIQGKDYWYAGRIDVFKRSLRRIGKFLKKGRLIDVGCGTGHFMDLARGNGWEVKGVEISDYAVGYAREKLGLDVIKASLKDAQFETEYFDVAVMWNVLDQIYDPRANLIELNRILKKGGYLFLRVPNLYFHLKLSWLYNRLRPLFKNIEISLSAYHLHSPSVFHLYSFDKDSIKKLLESTGFPDVIVKTELLDVNVPAFIIMFGEKREKNLRKLFDLGARVVYFLSFGKIIASPSIFVAAKKK